MDTQTIAVLVFIAAQFTRETLERAVDVSDVQLEILLSCKMSQAPRTRVHTNHLASLDAQRRTELGHYAQRSLQRQTTPRYSSDRPLSSCIARPVVMMEVL